MKSKYRRANRALALFPRTCVVVCTSLCAATSVQADQTWTGATDASWATLTNWSGGAIPLATENAVFDSTSTANLTAITLGANRAVNGVVVTNPPSDVTIATGNALTVGRGGIDLSNSTHNLFINAGVTAADGGRQFWKVKAGQTLTLAAAPTKATVSACPIEVGTTGTTVFTTTVIGGAAVATANLILDTANNPWVTFGPNDWAGLNAGTVVASTYTAVDGVTTGFTGLVGGVVNTITGNLTGANAIDTAAIRFNEATPYDVTVANSATARTMTARGILVTANSGGGSIGGNLNGAGFLRPNRTSGLPSFNIIQNSSADFTIGANLSNASSNTAVRLTKTGTGKLISLQNNGYSGGTFIGAGIVQFGNGTVGGFGFPGGGDIVNNGSLVMNRASDETLINNISGTGTFTQAGPGTLNLTTSVSTFTGDVNVTGGTLGVTSLANLGNGTKINVNGAGIKFLGVVDPSVRSIVIGAAGASFDTNGNPIVLSGPFASGSVGGVTKRGAGSLVLDADNDYAGGTTVAAGVLLANAPTSSTGTGPVVVNAGGAIGGAGRVSGAVTVESGANLTPGSGGIGTLGAGSLSLGSGSTGTFEFNNSPDNDKVAVSGSLTINGGDITLTDVTGSPVAFAVPGTYNLISHTGPIQGAGVSSLSVANKQPGFSYTFNDTGSMITLTIATSGVVGHWLTDGGGSWNAGANWNTNPTVPNGNGQTAIFDKVLGSPAVITLDGAKTVGAVTFSSAPNGYEIVPGSGGSLTLNNGANPATIANNVGVHTISANVALASNTELSSASTAESLTFSGIVSGSGSLTKPGPGALALTNANTFGGLLTLTGGATTFGNGGLGNGNLTISGASLVWGGGNSQDISNRTVNFGANPVTFDTGDNDVSLVAGAIGGGGTAAFTKAGNGKLTLGNDGNFTGNVTIAGGVLQLGTGGTTGHVAGAIANNGQLAAKFADGAALPNVVTGTGSFAHTGAGSLSLSGANTFTGLTSIASGASIRLLNPLALQGSTLDYVSSGGLLSFDVQTAVTLGGLQGDASLSLMNVDAVPAPVVLSVGGNNSTTSYGGILSGGGSLTKLGSGTLTLTGASTYTGATVVNGGVLTLGTGGTLGGSGLTVGLTPAAGTTPAIVGRMVVSGGTLTAPAANLGVGSGGLFVETGTAIIAGAVNAAGSTGSTNSGLVKISDGILTMASLTLGRGGLNHSTEPAEAPLDTNFHMTGGSVTITGNLFIGTGSAQPNSSVVTRVDSGKLTVDGTISVGLNNGGRWSTLDVNGGELVSTNPVDGIVLGGPFQGNSLLAVRGGVVTTEIVNFGQGAVNGNAVIRLTGGELDVGAGGINLASTGAFTSEIRLAGGTLGAKADWSTSRPVNVSGLNSSYINGGNAAGDPFSITFFGPLTGTGSLIKNGKGTVTLGGGHSYAGDTTVVEGTLKLASRTLSDTAIITVDTAGTLELAFSGGDKVAGLVIEGATMPDGIYGRVGTGIAGVTESPRITGNGLLYVNTEVPVSPGYDAWAALPANGLTAGVNDGPNQDPDGDGVVNQLEFVLGGNPGVSSASILPKLTTDANNFIFTFNRSDESLGQIGLAFQYGSNLAGWTDIIIPESTIGGAVTVTPGSPEDVITVTIPKGTNPLLFGRLKAVK